MNEFAPGLRTRARVQAWLHALTACLALAALMGKPSLADAAQLDAGECAASMVRLPFAYATPPPKYRDPRTALPRDLTVARRRELHTVLWPNDLSARTSVRQWLFEKNIACLEEGYADLMATQARYPDGGQKVVSFLGGARDFIEATRGSTDAEIDQLIADWRGRYPGSVLAELLWPRLLMAAAWAERGNDWAVNVAPDRMREFRRLAAVALRRTEALSPPAREHVLGHYVALRAIADNGASVAQIEAFALEALRRFPEESGLAVIAGERMLPKWGGSLEAFETFALRARDTVGPARADRLYAGLYMQAVGLEELHLHPAARLANIRAGMLELASQGTYDGILTLQEFACARRDAEALRQARRLWSAYADQPQLRAPQTELDARCRAWERSLPALDAPPAAAKPTPSGTSPATANLFHPVAAHDVARTVYDLDAGQWERQKTPAGEVLTCKTCEYAVQALVTVGPPLTEAAGFATNERFLATLDSLDSQVRAARVHTEQAIRLDPATSNDQLKIEKTELTQVDGVQAFRYESVLRFKRGTMRETALELVHKGRMLRVVVDRAQGPASAAELDAVQALIAGVRLQRQ